MVVIPQFGQSATHSRERCSMELVAHHGELDTGVRSALVKWALELSGQVDLRPLRLSRRKAYGVRLVLITLLWASLLQFSRQIRVKSER